MALTLQITRCEPVVVISCRGRIVFGEETTVLCKTIRDLLSKSPNIVLQLGSVRNIDSGGLGALVGLALAARRAGGDVKLCEIPRNISHVLDITRLRAVLGTFSTQAEAVADFAPRSAVA